MAGGKKTRRARSKRSRERSLSPTSSSSISPVASPQMSPTSDQDTDPYDVCPVELVARQSRKFILIIWNDLKTRFIY